MVVLENPSFIRGVGGVLLALLLHVVSSAMWITALSSAYWSRGSYSFLQALDAVHTVGVWKTCITYINMDPYTDAWSRKDGACWPTSKYLFDPRIEISNILSFLVCMIIVVVIGLYCLLYTNKSWRPFLKSVALPGFKLLEMSLGLAMLLVFSAATDVANNVRLWARHLAMASVSLMAVEVLYALVIGFTNRTWRTCLREICADMSVYVSGCATDFPGEAHRPTPPAVIQNNAVPLEEIGPRPAHPWPVQLEPEVQIACTDWPASVVLDIEEDQQEVPTATLSRGQKKISPFKHVFGRSTLKEETRANTRNNKRRPAKPISPIHVLPEPPQSPSPASPDPSRTVTFADDELTCRSREESTCTSEWTEMSGMARRPLPALPRPLPEFPEKISSDVTVLEGRL